MSIQIGKTIGAYEIVSHLGSGGMGEVYRASDPRLGRDVAIKVLPSNFATDPDRLQRFEQEARAAGMLNHPNILSVHDIGTIDGSTYLVTEYLEGETLREKLRSGPLSLRKTTDYALQLARGLSAAHDKGIVHRDLKPENLIITRDGRLKILDFGLAKLTQQDTSNSLLTQMPTSPGTEPGLVLGTMGYMSPEQVRGKIADHRSDIFSFGAILFEMITGTRAFRGETPADTMSAILHKDPDEIEQTNRSVPPALLRIVQHCLEKDPEQRFHSAGDIAFNLESLSGFSESAVTAIAAPAPAKVPVSLWQIISIGFLATTILFAFLYFQQTREPERILYASIELADNHLFPGGQDNGVAISPNGRYIVFPSNERNTLGRSLWIRDLEKSSMESLKGTEQAFYPFWSPDSEYVAFFAKGKLQKMKYSGGAVQTICDAPSGRGGSWSTDGTILFSPQPYGPLYQVPSGGGKPQAVTKVSDPEDTHRFPHFLPDGKHFVFSNDHPAGIFLGSMDSQNITQLNSDSSNSKFVSEKGLLLFVRQGTLVAQPLNLKKKRLEGEALPVLEEKIFYDSNRIYGFFDVSGEGFLCYRPATFPMSQPLWLDRSGKQLEIAGLKGDYDGARLSPQGDKFSFQRTDLQSGKTDLWVYELGTNRSHRLTQDVEITSLGIFAPDQSRVAYTVEGRIYVKRLTAAADETLLLESKYYSNVTSWSSDGRFLLFNPQSQRGDNDIWVLPTFGDRKPYPLVESRYQEGLAEFSPDGELVAYVSNASGDPQIYVTKFSQSDEVWQVSTNSGFLPRWSPDGSELFYFSGGKTVAVSVTKGDRISFGTPQPLFDHPPQTFIAGVHPDGRLLAFKEEQHAERTLRIVMNWGQLLKRS